MSVFTKVIAFVMVFALIMPVSVFAASPLQTAPGTPTLLSPTSGWTTTEVKPLITGLTQDKTDVAVYIDGVYNGQATVTDSGEGTANFNYRPFLNLSVGWHTIKVRAQDARNNLESAVTESHGFYVAPVNPQPTLLKPVVNDQTIWKKPFIVGLARNNTIIHVYIDDEYNGKIEVVDDASGTANFAYRPFLNLNPGKHQVYVVSEDARGHKSAASETLNFMVIKPEAQSTITQTTTQKQADESTEAEDSAMPEAAQETSEEENAEEVSEEEVAEEAVKEETPTAETQESKSPDESGQGNESPEKAAATDQDEADEKKDKTENENEKEETTTSAIGWGLLILIAAGLVYRNRKSIKNFFSENSENHHEDSSGSPSSGSVEVITKSSQDKEKPKSPPPASDY